MRSELFLIPHQLFGVPLFGFGVLLVAWIGFVAYLWWATRDSPPAQRDVIRQWPFYLLVAGAIVMLPRMFPDGLPIRGYGVMLLLGAATGLTMAVLRARGLGVDADTIFTLAFWMFVAGIVGARLFFVIEHWQSQFASLGTVSALWQALKFTEGGLVIYGGVMGATVAFVVFCLRYQLGVLRMADVIAPALLAGYALGRVGCLLHGCCFGGPCDLPWAVTFPDDSPPFHDQLARGEFLGLRLEEQNDGSLAIVRVDPGTPAAVQGFERGDVVTAINGYKATDLGTAAQVFGATYAEGQGVQLVVDGRTVNLPAATKRARSLPIHPTQVYSTINAALVATFLWFVYRLRPREGVVMGLALTLYPIARFLIEDIRVDETSFLGTGFSVSQNVSMALLAVMPIYWWWVVRRESAEPPRTPRID